MSKKKTTTKSKGKKLAKADPNLVPLSEMDKQKRAKPKKLSCLDAAAQVLHAKSEAMNTKSMVEAMREKKLWDTTAPTPAATLYSAILRELKTKGKEARFKKTERGLFVYVG